MIVIVKQSVECGGALDRQEDNYHMAEHINPLIEYPISRPAKRDPAGRENMQYPRENTAAKCVFCRSRATGAVTLAKPSIHRCHKPERSHKSYGFQPFILAATAFS